MPRRRATDTDDHYDGEDLPTTISDADGKTRTPTERIGRYLRTRPVTSLLIIILLIVVSIITFFIGRSVGTLVISFFQSRNHTQTPSSPAITDLNKTETLNDTALHPALSASQVRHNDDNSLDNEHGPLLDGVDPHEGVQTPPDRHTVSSSHNNTCYRKFEPGKLGWPKMLCITDEYYFDISIASTPIGRIKIGVFGNVVAKSAENFRALVTCTGPFATQTLCYRGDTFHRIVTNFVIQGGSKATGRSIYGATFREEKSPDRHSFLQHAERGVVSWAEYPIGSQFFILLNDEAKYLDNNHVVFGIVTDGFDVLDKIHDAPRLGEEPTGRVIITDCGDIHSKA